MFAQIEVSRDVTPTEEEKEIEDQDGSVTLYKMHQVTPLLEVLSGKVKDPRDILGTPP